jgi:hypothetical protein
MGVMLSLDQHGPTKRRRPGQHARHPGLPVRVQAVVALRRHDRPSAGRLLSGLTRTLLARRTVAARAPQAPGAAAPEWSLYPGLSVACLLGECRDESGRPACDASRCEHDCHRDAAAGDGPAAATRRPPDAAGPAAGDAPAA